MLYEVITLVQIAKNSMFFAENMYANGFYKVYSQIFSSITGLVPFSVADVITSYSIHYTKLYDGENDACFRVTKLYQ